MQMRNIIKQRLMLFAACAAITLLLGDCTRPQSSNASNADQKPGPPAPGVAGAVYGNLEQIMVGIMFPAANIVGVGMERDALKIPLADDQVTTTDPMGLISVGWRAVENAGICIAGVTAIMM